MSFASTAWLTTLHQRLLSAALLIPLALAVMVIGGEVLLLTAMALGVLLAGEWSRMTGVGSRVSQGALMAAVAAAALASHVFGLAAGLTAVLAGSLGVALVARWRGQAPGWMALAVLWFGLPVACLLWLRQAGEHGLIGVVLVLLTIWATDSGAFFAGRALGGAKLAPSISPGKTWSGAVGGLLAAMLTGGALAAVTGLADILALTVLCGVLAVAAELGDLAESAAKRRFGVKDSGHLIPGHGGVFDRLDALLFALPVAVLAAMLNGGALLPWH